MTCTSNRSMRNSGHGRFGVSLTHSLLRSRNWIQFRSLRQRRISVNSWKRAFQNRSDLRGGTGQATPPESIYSEVSSVKVAGSNWHAQNSRLAGASTCHRVGRLQFAQGMIKKIVVAGPRGGRCEIRSYSTKTQPIQTQCIRVDKRQQKRADPPLQSRLLQTIRSTARATLARPQGDVWQEYPDCHQQDSGACHDRGCLCF